MFLFVKNNVQCHQCGFEGDSKNKVGFLALFFLLVLLAVGAYRFFPRGGHYLFPRAISKLGSIAAAGISIFSAIYVGARRDAHKCRHCGSEWVSEK